MVVVPAGTADIALAVEPEVAGETGEAGLVASPRASAAGRTALSAQKRGWGVEGRGTGGQTVGLVEVGVAGGGVATGAGGYAGRTAQTGRGTAQTFTADEEVVSK